MTTEELKELLKNNQGCNLIACSGSVLQVNGVNAAIMYLKSMGIQLDGYVILECNNGFNETEYKEKYILTDSKVKHINSQLLFSDLHWWQRIAYIGKSGLLERDLKRDENIYIISESFRFYWIKIIHEAFPDRKIVFVEIDDGASNYRKKISDQLYNRLAASKKLLYPYNILSYIAKRIFNNDFSMLLKENGCYIDAKVMCEDCNVIVPNDRVFEYWDQSFRKNITSEDYRAIRMMEKCILILGTNWKGKFLASFLELAGEIKKIADEHGLKVVIKPHPRDDRVDDYTGQGIEVYTNRHVAAEEIIATLEEKPKMIIGYGSSALLNAKVLYGIPSVSYTSVIAEGWYGKYFGKVFAKRFGDIVNCPLNISQVREVIESIKA